MSLTVSKNVYFEVFYHNAVKLTQLSIGAAQLQPLACANFELACVN